MSDLVERVRDVLPSVRGDLEDLVRIQSVWADPAWDNSFATALALRCTSSLRAGSAHTD